MIITTFPYLKEAINEYEQYGKILWFDKNTNAKLSTTYFTFVQVNNFSIEGSSEPVATINWAYYSRSVSSYIKWASSTFYGVPGYFVPIISLRTSSSFQSPGVILNKNSSYHFGASISLYSKSGKYYKHVEIQLVDAADSNIKLIYESTRSGSVASTLIPYYPASFSLELYNIS